MITIRKTITTKTDGCFCCSAEVEMGTHARTYELRFGNDCRLSNDTLDRSDAFLSLVVLEAAENEEDIHVDGAVSEDLLYGLNAEFLPVVAKAFGKRSVTVSAQEVAPSRPNTGSLPVEIPMFDDGSADKLHFSCGDTEICVDVAGEIDPGHFRDRAIATRLVWIIAARILLGSSFGLLRLIAPEQCGHFNFLSDHIFDYVPMITRAFSTSYAPIVVDCRNDAASSSSQKSLPTNDRTITIGQPTKREEGALSRVEAKITIGEKEDTLYFETQSRYAEGLISDRIDAFVVMLLYEAMRNGFDIVSDSPISEELYERLQLNYIPMITSRLEGLKSIALHMPVTNKHRERASMCATGFSGGVDSMLTLAKHEQRTDRYRITGLAVFNAGVFECEDPRRVFEEALGNIEAFGQTAGMQATGLTSNIDDIVRVPYHCECTVRLCACALALGGIWGDYVISSTKPLSKMGFSATYADAAELLHAACFSTHYLTFHLCGEDLTRLDKMKYLAHSEARYIENLHPCVHEPIFGRKNCGTCPKCIRAMYTFDKLGVLDRAAKAFPLDYYHQNQEAIAAKLLSSFRENSFDEELVKEGMMEECGEGVLRRARELKAIKKLIASRRQEFVDRGKEGGIIVDRYIFEPKK